MHRPFWQPAAARNAALIVAFRRVRLTLICLLASFCSVAAEAPVFGYRVVHTYTHDPHAFTQGLIYLDGSLYESTGQYGQSSVRKVKLETGEVLKIVSVPPQYFGEGLTEWKDNLIQLTWKSGTGFVYDRTTFERKSTFVYGGEGWGLTHDATRLIQSDGSSTLRLIDPETLRQIGSLAVTDGGSAVDQLNELEYIKGEIYANVWQTERIAVISPKTGQVLRWIDLTGLLPAANRTGNEDVLNGIAYDAAKDRIFVTGKWWPKLFEIKVVAKTKATASGARGAAMASSRK
jgi:glutamine cyclotransferase